MPIEPTDLGSKQLVFYDGLCGLCHRWVKFTLPRDPQDRFVFSPIQGDTIQRLLTAKQIADLPDSIVLRRPDGELRVKSEAVLSILESVGGGWGVLARLGRLAPRRVRDFFYDRVAAVRHRVFAKPEEACPMLPPELRHKFVF